LGKINLWLWDPSGQFAPSIEQLNRLQNLRIRKSFTVAYYRDIVLMQQMLSFTSAIAILTLTSSCKTVRQHIMHVRQSSYYIQCATQKFIHPDLWPPIAAILILLIIAYGGGGRRDARSCVRQTQIQDVADLTQRLVDTWSGFSQSVVDDAINEWQKNWILFRLCNANV